MKGQHQTLFVQQLSVTARHTARSWAALRRGEAQTHEFKRIAQDGTYRLDQATYNPVLDRNGRVARIVKLATDVTAQVLRKSIMMDSSMPCTDRRQ